jgi:predicted ATPase
MLGRLRGQTLLSAEEWQDAPTRHLTLRRAIEWSYDLLDAAEQAAFRQLGVFVGSWTLEAAEAIIHDGEAVQPAWITLSRLVDKSLVQSEAGVRQRPALPVAGADPRIRAGAASRER